MMNGWTLPAVFIFIAIQATAAVWWASGTDTEVKQNTTAIEQVVENSMEIAVIQVQQAEIVKDGGEIKKGNKELMIISQQILDKINETD